jgi:hypothetical protein
MNNPERLLKKMQPGKVYRRKNLEGFTTAVDRDLKTLVERGEVRRVAPGLYSRPRPNAFGIAPPDDADLVRAFLKSHDFLLTSYNHFTQLGLGLTQVYNVPVVYNHKRTGQYGLGGKQFLFRLVASYPKKLSREFLVVDLLNNLNRLPDNTDVVLENLKLRLNEFDRKKVKDNLERYGGPAARQLLQEAYVYVHS